MKRTLPLLFGLILAFSSSAQLIKTKVQLSNDEWKDTISFLAIHKGNTLVVVDTIRLDDEGKGVYKKMVQPGQYALFMPNRTQYEVIINEKRLKLSIEKGKMNYHNSLENALYSEFLKVQNPIDRKRRQLLGRRDPNVPLTLEKLNQDENKRAIFKLRNDDIIEKTLAGKIINATCRPQDLGYYKLNLETARANPALFLKYLDIEDSRMLYTQVFNERLRFYLTTVLEQDAEVIIPALTDLIERSKVNQETYHFITDFYLGFYQRSRLAAHELVFKYFVEEYCLKGQMPWIEEHQLKRLEGQVDMLRNQLLGTKHTLLDVYTTEGNQLFYDTLSAEYKLLLFWDPDCYHCKKDVPEYHKIYKGFRKEGFDVVAIYGESDKEGWLRFIEKKGLVWRNTADLESKGNLKEAIILRETPTVMLLDKNNIIVKKRFTPEELRAFLQEKLR